MNETNEKKKIVILLVLLPIIAIAVVLFLYWEKEPPSQTIDISKELSRVLEPGIDYSNSLYPDEDIVILNQRFNDFKDVLLNSDANNIDPKDILNIATLFKSAKDYESALRLYKIIDQIQYKDLDYRIEMGRIYKQQGGFEEARKILEPLKIDWPVPDVFIELAEVYKNIPGTPQYVVDQIYLEGIDRNASRMEIIDAYLEWLERTNREEKTLPYYEQLQKASPDPFYEQKINELKQKYS